jgi:LPS sulfotransferase NodH
MSASKDDVVTIVSGLPRSGTSMMMQLLDAGGIPALIDEVRAADEDNPKGYYEFEPVKKTREDASWLGRAGGKVVKMVYRLLYDLPEDHSYRVIFMRRKLEEVITSQNVMLERQKKEGGGLSDERLLKVFRAEIDKSNKWLAEQPNFKVLYVNYNEMLADPAPQIARINEFLGGDLDTRAMMRIVDPALYRQRH